MLAPEIQQNRSGDTLPQQDGPEGRNLAPLRVPRFSRRYTGLRLGKGMPMCVRPFRSSLIVLCAILYLFSRRPLLQIPFALIPLAFAVVNTPWLRTSTTNDD